MKKLFRFLKSLMPAREPSEYEKVMAEFERQKKQADDDVGLTLGMML